jgi:hypothetical protein
MMKALILLLLGVVWVAYLAGCFRGKAVKALSQDDALHLVIDNRLAQTLWVDAKPGSIHVAPNVSTISAQSSVNLTISPSGFSDVSMAFNVYASPAKLEKKVIIAIKNNKVFVRQCSHCTIKQSDKYHATVVIAS